MAEYVDVVKQHSRMCRHFQGKNGCCNGCPIEENALDDYCDGVTREIDDGDIRKIEKLVMDWTEKNTEPIYPTWTDFLKIIGVLPMWVRVECLNTHIDARIAEKLGLEPVKE